MTSRGGFASACRQPQTAKALSTGSLGSTCAIHHMHGRPDAYGAQQRTQRATHGPLCRDGTRIAGEIWLLAWIFELEDETATAWEEQCAAHTHLGACDGL